MSLKIIFAGTAEFAVPSLQALANSTHQVVAVYTQPDRPAGRGQHLHLSPVKQYAQSQSIPVLQPRTLKSATAQATLRDFNADVMIVVAYGLIIPQAVLDSFQLGCFNLHPSLLPRWRGAAPIQRSILAGDTMTGICVIQMNSDLDAGPIVWQQNYPIDLDMNSGELHDLLAVQGAHALLATLDQCEQRRLQPVPQIAHSLTYATKISKEEAVIDWQRSAIEIHNQIRAFNPWPIAHTDYRQQSLRIWQSAVLSENVTALPGTIVHCSKEGIDVATKQGQLRLCVVQLPGGKPMTAQDFLNGQRAHLIVGQTRLGLARDHLKSTENSP